jgi:hypothetical protein
MESWITGSTKALLLVKQVPRQLLDSARLGRNDCENRGYMPRQSELAKKPAPQIICQSQQDWLLSVHATLKDNKHAFGRRGGKAVNLISLRAVGANFDNKHLAYSGDCPDIWSVNLEVDQLSREGHIEPTVSEEFGDFACSVVWIFGSNRDFPSQGKRNR